MTKKKSIEAAKKLFVRYRMKKLAAEEEYLPRITSKFMLDIPSYSLEMAVIKKVDSENEYANLVDYLNRGLKKLNVTERQIIVMSYLEDEPYFAYQIANELNVAERTFHRMKNLALVKLAVALRIAVFREEELDEIS
ncbi:ArpU family phage packaging/lysis transcriptional regulator [Lysinibacillus boronitolerans]|uniref:ArpU family phage packaging/lysis transcriptional regulator n=1 Tax=Lysinibacillus boronitolerans TaxID=309788 RepID=UPI0003692A83|nr:ArpU family phage packaging/lysis transcriptional regulator [Lysinibacillus boronitolerans]